jgi:hypothetical protein
VDDYFFFAVFAVAFFAPFLAAMSITPLRSQQGGLRCSGPRKNEGEATVPPRRVCYFFLPPLAAFFAGAFFFAGIVLIPPFGPDMD